MPELPEVETICTALRDVIEGQELGTVRFNRKSLRDPIPVEAVRKTLVSRTVQSVKRRSKYILIETDKGACVVHLGMTGVFHCYETAKAQKKHTHFVIEVRRKNGTQFLHYIDPRRFGRLGVIGKGAEKWLENLGPEPFENREKVIKHLMRRAEGRKQTIKSFIMDPANIVGVGNIYVAESLFQSGILPMRLAGNVSEKEMRLLTKNIVATLKKAIKVGGTSFRDFKDINGETGYFSLQLKVYGRENESCSKCKSMICRETISGRSSFYCPTCQV